ncbi:hypothetical protein BDM02DRAFT_3261202 [Thelephora ganbajun]|uniref:Uncharacterized protein n=1 Tax=Thelephora ganbajun TaxID=370292 RepID=A0ACB6ZF04_THEGA|nr:hypothetical protein BDM02DRAFT_3261202 [Thelephora ganbajun]
MIPNDTNANGAAETSSILKNGKLKPGIYQIQNLIGQTFVEMQGSARTSAVGPRRRYRAEKWDFQPFRPGYTIRKVYPKGSSKPDLYCAMLEGLGNRSSVAVSPYPAAWKIQIVDEEKCRGFEYIRVVWSTTEMVWDLAWWGNSSDGNKVQVFAGNSTQPCQNWKLIPIDDKANTIRWTGTATRGCSTCDDIESQRSSCN